MIGIGIAELVVLGLLAAGGVVLFTRLGLRLSLRLAGVVCLAVGLFPYYSHTDGPPAGGPTIDLPLVGSAERSCRTVFRLGLPVSPLFLYDKEVVVESRSATVPGGDGQIVNTSQKYRWNWNLEFASWSGAVAAVGVVLFVLSLLVGRRRPAG